MSARPSLRWAFAGLCGALLVAPSLSRAQSPGGQRITLMIGAAIGGGYDLDARLVARFLGRYLPGRPSIVPQNMPGATAVRLANWLTTIAPQDGSVIAALQTSTAYEPLFGNNSAQFDARKFQWLSSLNRMVNLAVVWHDAPVATASDFFRKEVVVGGSTGFMARLMNAIIGTRYKVVVGYPGLNDVALAMERHEVDGMIGTSWESIKATRSDWLADKKIRVLMQIALERHPELADIPSAIDYVKTAEDRAVLQLILARLDAGRPFVAPPGTPPAQVTQFRDAFDKMYADPEFLEEAHKLKAEVRPLSGKDIEGLVLRSYATPAPIVEKATAFIKSSGG